RATNDMGPGSASPSGTTAERVANRRDDHARSLCPRRRRPQPGAEEGADGRHHRRGGEALRHAGRGRGGDHRGEPEGQQGEGGRAVYGAVRETVARMSAATCGAVSLADRPIPDIASLIRATINGAL